MSNQLSSNPGESGLTLPPQAEDSVSQHSALRTRLAFLGRGYFLSPSQLHLFTIHLEIMLRCGMTLMQSLDVLSRQADLKASHCAKLLAGKIEKGLRFSQALALQPENFSETYICVMQAAEESGTLPSSLGRLAEVLSKQMRTWQTFKSALIYPLLLLASSGGLILVMLYFIFPMVVTVTQNAGVEPPALTRMLMSVTKPSVGLAFLLICLLLATLVVTALRNSYWGPRIRKVAEKHTPLGKFFVRLQILESTQQLALLIANGVDLLTSLKYTLKVGAQSVLLAEAYEDIILRVRMGLDLHSAYALHPIFPSMLGSMLAVAAEAGKTPEMLRHFCTILEEELDTSLERFTTALEPIMLGVLGSVIAVLLIAAFMPIYNLIAV